MAAQRKRRFLVLGPDPEFGNRLYAVLEPADEFVARLKGRHIDLVTRHANSECGALRPNARGAGGFREPCGSRG
jgi:hypothetical protein